MRWEKNDKEKKPISSFSFILSSSSHIWLWSFIVLFLVFHITQKKAINIAIFVVIRICCYSFISLNLLLLRIYLLCPFVVGCLYVSRSSTQKGIFISIFDFYACQKKKKSVISLAHFLVAFKSFFLEWTHKIRPEIKIPIQRYSRHLKRAADQADSMYRTY